MLVIDNFLKPQEFKNILKDFESENFPWFFKKEDVPGNRLNKNGFFNHCYFNNIVNSSYFNSHIVPFIDKLNVKKFTHVRANLTLRDKDSLQCAYHTDNNDIKSITAIFFLTNCNSVTKIRLGNNIKQIESVQNRIVIFKSFTPHKVIYPTNVHKRFVINFNYETN
jgi:hypothetical protein|tara:strand:+ start:1130 stop:1627 length:498 start_codon:yes stop_codon:yes gene_type:complete